MKNFDPSDKDRFFYVGHLVVDQLLKDWRWLCPEPLTLIARTAFGDLFLMNRSGEIFKLDVALGEYKLVSESEGKFRLSLLDDVNRQAWLQINEELSAHNKGLVFHLDQCIAFKTPLIFAESVQ